MTLQLILKHLSLAGLKAESLRFGFPFQTLGFHARPLRTARLAVLKFPFRVASRSTLQEWLSNRFALFSGANHLGGPNSQPEHRAAHGVCILIFVLAQLHLVLHSMQNAFNAKNIQKHINIEGG